MPAGIVSATMARLGRRTARLAGRFRRDRRGNYSIEFGLVALPFLALLFATFDSAMIFFKAEYLQSAISDAGRLIFTGQAQTSSYTQAQFKQAVCDRLPVMISCNDVYIDVRTYTDFSSANRYNPVDAAGNFNQAGLQYNPGSRNSIVVVTGYVQHGMFMSMIATYYKNLANGKILLTASAAFRNEPFGS